MEGGKKEKGEEEGEGEGEEEEMEDEKICKEFFQTGRLIFSKLDV